MRPPVPTWLLTFLLLLIPILSISNFFAYHAPGAIGSSIQEYFSMDEEDLASLFTIYSAPNIILAFLGGILIDKYGLVRTSLIFNLSILVGMIIFASAPRGGGSLTMFHLLFGRFLLGVGGACVLVCASAMIARWFKYSSIMTFALGFNSALVQLLGSAPTFVLLPYLLGDAGMNRLTPGSLETVPFIIINSTTSAPVIGTGSVEIDTALTVGNVRLCLWVIVIVCSISLLANIVYALLELRYGFIYITSELEEEFSRVVDAEMFRLEIQQSTSKEKKSKKKKKKPKTKKTKAGEYSIVELHESHSGDGDGGETNENVIVDDIHERDEDDDDFEFDDDELSDEHERKSSDSSRTNGSSSAASHHIRPLNTDSAIHPFQNDADSHHTSLDASSPSSSSSSSSSSNTATNGTRNPSKLSLTSSTPPETPHGMASSASSSTQDEHNTLLNGLINLRSLWDDSMPGQPHSPHTTLLSLHKPWMIIKSFPPLFWLTLTMQVLLSPILYTFTAFGPLFMMEKYHLTQEEAGFLTSLLYIAIILAPGFGFIIDKIGYRCIIQTIAAVLIPLSFLLLHLTTLNPYVIMLLLGMSFAITDSNGLAMIADVSPPDLLGTAYGILGCGTSLFLLIEPYMVGYLHIHTGEFYWSTILFVILSGFGWLASFAVYVYDVNHDNLMSESAKKRNEDDSNVEMSETNSAYPELNIVFDQDPEEEDEDEDEIQLFALDDIEALESLP